MPWSQYRLSARHDRSQERDGLFTSPVVAEHELQPLTGVKGVWVVVAEQPHLGAADAAEQLFGFFVAAQPEERPTRRPACGHPASARGASYEGRTPRGDGRCDRG